MRFISKYWDYILVIIVITIDTIIYEFDIINVDYYIITLLITLTAYLINFDIKHRLKIDGLSNRLGDISFAKVLNDTTAFFITLLRAIRDDNTKNISVTYFTQTPPTEFYHLPYVKNYWEGVPKSLKNNPDKTLRRIVLVSNNEMVDWLSNHLEENRDLPNLSLGALVEVPEEYPILNLCLTDIGECILFSPHSYDEQPCYIWLSDKRIYQGLLLAFDRLWEKSIKIKRGPKISEQGLSEIKYHVKRINQ